MRIIVDTNILISAALFPDSRVSACLLRAMSEHTLVICTYVLEEVQEVFSRKFPNKTARLDAFLSNLAYELCYTPLVTSQTPEMRDADDRPILQAAIDTEADAILTGDKDFHALSLDHPLIFSPAMLVDVGVHSK